MMQKILLLIIYTLLGAGVSFASEIPREFKSREEATRAGCLFASIMGPSVDACYSTSYHDNQMDLAVYKRSEKGTFPRFELMPIGSWYWDATLKLVDVLHDGTLAFVIEAEGMRGTGVHQQVLLVINWDGSRFRTLAAETLENGCSTIEAKPTYELLVRYTFRTHTREMNLNYVLLKNECIVGHWSEVLSWSGSSFSFVQGESKTEDADSIGKAIIDRVHNVRKYSMARPLDPTKDGIDWIGQSGLMEVLDPACDYWR